MSKLVMPSSEEPDLSMHVESGADRLVLRNILYAVWAMLGNTGRKWTVERTPDGRGFLLLIPLGKEFCIGLREMQVILCNFVQWSML
jgi:hypothetical protein